MPKAIEIYIGATVNRDERLVLELVFGDVFLDAGNRKATGRLDDRSCVFEDVAYSGTDLVGIDRDDLVNELLTKAKGLIATRRTATPSANIPT